MVNPVILSILLLKDYNSGIYFSKYLPRFVFTFPAVGRKQAHIFLSEIVNGGQLI